MPRTRSQRNHSSHPGRGMATTLGHDSRAALPPPLPPPSSVTMDFPPTLLASCAKHACRGDGQEEAWRKRGSPRWPSSREFYTAQLSALVDKSLDNGLLLLLPSLPCLTFPPHGLERCRGAEDREKEEEKKEDGGEIKGDLRFGKEGFTDVNLTCAVRLRINRFEFF